MKSTSDNQIATVLRALEVAAGQAAAAMKAAGAMAVHTAAVESIQSVLDELAKDFESL